MRGSAAHDALFKRSRGRIVTWPTTSGWSLYTTNYSTLYNVQHICKVLVMYVHDARHYGAESAFVSAHDARHFGAESGPSFRALASGWVRGTPAVTRFLYLTFLHSIVLAMPKHVFESLGVSFCFPFCVGGPPVLPLCIVLVPFLA